MNNKGFTLIEVMIGAGILAFSAVVLFKSMDMRSKTSSDAKKHDSIASLMQDFQGILGDESICKDSLSNNGVNAIISEIKRGGVSYYKIGTVMPAYPGIKIQKMMIKRISNIGGRSMATLELTIEKKSARANGNPAELKRYVSVSAKMNGATIASCSTRFLSDENKKASCENIGGIYNNSNCTNTIEKNNCVSTGGSWNIADQACDRSKEEFCTSVGGTWSAGSCIQL